MCLLSRLQRAVRTREDVIPKSSDTHMDMWLYYYHIYSVLALQWSCRTVCICMYEACMQTFASLTWAHSLLSRRRSTDVEDRLEVNARLVDCLLNLPHPPINHPATPKSSSTLFSSPANTPTPLHHCPTTTMPPLIALWWYNLFFVATFFFFFGHTELSFPTCVWLSVITPHCNKVWAGSQWTATVYLLH